METHADTPVSGWQGSGSTTKCRPSRNDTGARPRVTEPSRCGRYLPTREHGGSVITMSSLMHYSVYRRRMLAMTLPNEHTYVCGAGRLRSGVDSHVRRPSRARGGVHSDVDDRSRQRGPPCWAVQQRLSSGGCPLAPGLGPLPHGPAACCDASCCSKKQEVRWWCIYQAAKGQEAERVLRQSTSTSFHHPSDHSIISGPRSP